MDLSRRRAVLLAVLLFLAAAVPATSQVAGDLRLSTGRGISNGRLQVYIGGEWGEICDTGFGMNEGDVACHQLGFKEAVSVGDGNNTFGTVGRVLIHNIDCPNNNFLHLLRCGHQLSSTISCADNGYVVLNCSATPIWNDPYSGQLRITRGSYPSQGLVEVYCNGQWGTICDDQFGQDEADTVCRQLGYTEADQYDMFTFQGTTGQPIWLDDVVCSSVKECLHSCQRCPPTQLHGCGHFEDITIQCSINTLHPKIGANQTSCDLEQNGNRPRDGEIRLVNVTSGQIANSSGVVEVRYESQWRRICPPSLPIRRSYLSTTACRQLGFNRAVGNNIMVNNGAISQLSFQSPTAQWHVLRNGFSLTSNCSSFFTITCDNNGAIYTGQVRLRGGQYPSEGRVEIYLNNQWGTICANGPIFLERQLSHLRDEADAVCRQLGYTSAVVFSEGTVPGNGSVWIVNPSCPPFRATSISCFKECYYGYSPFSVQYCNHSQDFAVNCTYVAAGSAINPSGNERNCVDTRPPTTPSTPYTPFPPVDNLARIIAGSVFGIMLTISLIISIIAIVCVAYVTRCGKKGRHHRTCINTTDVDTVRFVPQSAASSAASTSSTSENEKQSRPL